MLTYGKAEKLAATWVDLISDGACALLHEKTISKPYGWVFFWTSRAWIESRDDGDAVGGNAPIIVSRGGEIRVTGTALPVEEYIATYEASIPPARLK
jgi:hypothetical protein